MGFIRGWDWASLRIGPFWFDVDVPRRGWGDYGSLYAAVHFREHRIFSIGGWPANVILTDPIFDGGWDGVVGVSQ